MRALFSLLFLTIISKIICKKDKIPVYLSIKADTLESRPSIYNTIKEHLQEIIIKYGDDYEILKDIEDISSNPRVIFSEPDSWHITCFYVGNNASALQDPIYLEFKEGIKVDIDISTIIYIPQKIISAPVFPNYSPIQNKFPHVTMLLGSYSAVDSNYVLEAVFGGKYTELQLLYQDGFIKEHSNLLNIELNDVEIVFGNPRKREVVPKLFIIKLGNNLKLKGKTKKNY
jgi:hypothetical protein